MQLENSEPGDSLSLTVKRWIDDVCTRFEIAWQQEPPPRIEEFLGNARGSTRQVLLSELLGVEFDCRRERGHVLPVDDYLARFPDQEQLIREEIAAAPGIERQLHPEAARETVTVAAGAVTTLSASRSESEGSIPGYEIRGRLGRGAMGIVSEAWQINPRRKVALKVIRGGEDAHPEELGRFRQEAEAAAQLQHANIVQIFQVGEHNGLPYFSMELCGAGSLDQYLRSGPLTPAEAAALVQTLAQAMHHAHQAKVIHRDLKPANIMLSLTRATAEETAKEGTRPPLSSLLPKVGDFGLARQLDTGGQTRTGAIIGTASYMAPEQASGRSKDVGPASDTYALGAILYECLTGRAPFKAATVMDTLRQVISDEPAPPTQLNAGIPRDLETICLKCLSKEPARRYSTSQALADDLGRFLRREPVHARPVGKMERGWRWCRRNPAVASLGATALLALLTGTAISWAFAMEANHRADEEEVAKDAAVAARRELEKTNKELTQSQAALLKSTDSLVTSGARILMHPFALSAQVKRHPFEPLFPLSDLEIGALWELESSQDDRLRLRFLEEALREPDTTRLLKGRADVALQATIGLNSTRRKQVQKLFASYLDAKGITEEHQVDAALLLAHLGPLDRSLARKTAATLLQAMPKTRDQALQSLSQALSAVTLKEAPLAAESIIQAMSKTGYSPEALRFLSQTMLAVADRMEPKEAANATITFMSKTTDPSELGYLAPKLSAMAVRMERKDASRVCGLAAETLTQAMSRTTDPSLLNILSQSLSVLAARMEPKDASRVCRVAAETLTRTVGAESLTRAVTIISMDPPQLQALSDGLTAIAARLEPKDASRLCGVAAETLTQAMSRIRDTRVLRIPSQRLSMVAAHMDPKEAARVCGLAAETLSQAIRRSTDQPDLQALSEGLTAIAARLEPKEASRVCGLAAETLTEAMSKTTDPIALQSLLQGLAGVETRLERKDAAVLNGRAAEILIQTIKQQSQSRGSRPRAALASLPLALSAVAARMEPKEASRVSGLAAETLTQAMSKTTDSRFLAALLEGLSALAARLEPKEGATVAATLTQAMGKTTEAAALQWLWQGLSVVAARMEPKDASRVCGLAAETLTQAMSRTTNRFALQGLSEGLTATAALMEPKEAATVAATLTQAMGKTTEAAALQWLWQGLSVVAARMEPKEAAVVCGQAAATLTQAMGKTTDAGALQLLSQGLSVVAAGMNPKDASRVCGVAAETLTQAMSKRTAPPDLQALSEGLTATAALMEPKEAARVFGVAAETLTEAMSKTTDPMALRSLLHGLAGVETRLERKDAAVVNGRAAEILIQTIKKLPQSVGSRDALVSLAQALSAVAARMEPNEASRVSGLAAETLIQAITNTTDSNMLLSLCQGLSALAARLEPKEAGIVCGRAADCLIQAMAKSTTLPQLQSLSQELAAILPRETSIALRQRKISVTVTVAGLGGPGTPFATLPCLQLALDPQSPPLPAQTLVDLLKHPLCVGEPRQMVLGQLARRYDRPFADQWEFVEYVQQHKLDLDLSTPLQRAETVPQAAVDSPSKNTKPAELPEKR
jgi:serine/threonine protein kinase/DNA-binding phage protein